MLNAEALYQYLAGEGFDPEFVEQDTEIIIPCSLCQDDRARLYINSDNGTWLCFHCSSSGSLLDLLIRVCQLEGHDAFELRRQIYREDSDDPFEGLSPLKAKQVEAPSAIDLPPEFHPCSEPTPEVFSRYLARRGVTRELALSRGIGWAAAGFYRWRVILPVVNQGVLYSFVARTVLKQCPECGLGFDACTCRRPIPKVLNGDSTRSKQTLYNLDFIKDAEEPIITEGPFDALRLPDRSVALFGSSISPTQVRLLAELPNRSDVVVCLDGDKAGRHGNREVADALASAMIPCRVAKLPDGADPGSLAPEELEGYIRNAKRHIL